MFRITNSSEPLNLSDLKGKELTTLLCSGIVNPFGPTLTAISLRGSLQPNQELDILAISLNPFAQSVDIVGRAQLRGRWNPEMDFEPLYPASRRYSKACPTLVFPSATLDKEDALRIHSQWLQGFPDAGKTWSRIQKFRFDPWNRVSAEIKEGTSQVLNRDAKAPQNNQHLADAEAVRFAEFMLSENHTKLELQAFMSAWSGAIDFQRANGAAAVLPNLLAIKGFAEWFSHITLACRLPELEGATAH